MRTSLYQHWAASLCPRWGDGHASSPAISSLLQARDLPLAPLAPGAATEALAVRRDSGAAAGMGHSPVCSSLVRRNRGRLGEALPKRRAPLRPPRHGLFSPFPLHVLVKQEGKLPGMLCATPWVSLVKTIVLATCFFGVRCVIPTFHSFPTSPHPRTKSYQELKMEEFQVKLKNLVFCYCPMLSTIQPLLVCEEYVSRV